MNALHHTALMLHIGFGFAALAMFWVVAFTRKGSPTHRKAGWVYMSAMLVVVATAVVMAVLLALNPQGTRDFTGVPPEEIPIMIARLRGVSAFFGALALLTFTAGWNGLQALRTKRASHRMRAPVTVGLYWLNMVVGPPLVALGLSNGEPLLIIFAIFCLLTGAGGLWSLWRPAPDPQQWLFRHFTNTLTTGIAAHTAFFAVGAVRLFPYLYTYSPVLYVIPWIMPSLIGGVAIMLLKRRYRGKGHSLLFPTDATTRQDGLSSQRQHSEIHSLGGDGVPRG